MARILCIDPGETTGWALFEGGDLIEAGQTPLWEFIDELWVACMGAGPMPELPTSIFEVVDQIVCEDWAIYPWEAKALAWDKCRTARGIGAIELIARQSSTEITLQPAKIKEAAVAAGAEDLFLSPLHENRHANDAIMHGVYFNVRARAQG